MNKFSRGFAVLLAGGLFLSSLALVACGGDDSSDSASSSPTSTSAPAQASNPTATTTASAPATAPAAGNAVTLNVSVIDFGYNPAALNVQPGQTVTLNVTNSGQSPHTFTISGVVDSAVGAGATRQAQFAAGQSGSLQYFCTVHGARLMSGTLTIGSGGASAAPTAQPGSSDPGLDYTY